MADKSQAMIVIENELESLRIGLEAINTLLQKLAEYKPKYTPGREAQKKEMETISLRKREFETRICDLKAELEVVTVEFLVGGGRDRSIEPVSTGSDLNKENPPLGDIFDTERSTRQ